MADHPHVLVVGAGIIGTSIAWHLASAGARVTILDAAEGGGVATPHSWAWINATWGSPEAYFRLRRRSMREWRRLESEVPGLVVAWLGALNWELPPDELNAMAAERIAWGYDVRRVDRTEVLQLEPRLAEAPAAALHVASEGSVEPLAAAQALLSAARDLGARFIGDAPVRSLELRGGKVVGVETETGRYTADQVVIAAGVGSAALTASVGIDLPFEDSPALLLLSKPAPKLLNGLVVTPEMELRQRADGRLIAGANFTDGDSAAAEVIFNKIRHLLQDSDGLELETHMIGRRPMPADGFPAVGAIDGVAGLYVAVMHSGITLAPAIGRFVTEELLTGRRDPLLAPYGLARFVQA